MKNFKATSEQILLVLTAAVNASVPVGMGIMHFQDKDYTSEDMPKFTTNYEGKKDIYTDYFSGRMTKTGFTEVGEGIWSMRPEEPSVSYHSWASTYSTSEKLIESVISNVEYLE